MPAATHLEACLNCGTDLTGPYCAQCGQKNTSPRLEARDVAADLAEHLLQVDSGLLRTLRGLSRNPGRLAREYVFGMRTRYVNPFKYCLTITALFLAWNLLIGYDVTGAVDPAAMANAFGSEGGEKAAVVLPFVERTVKTHLNTAIFLALPIFALALRRLYRRSGFNFAETYAFLLFVTGHTYLVGMLLSVVGLVVPAAALVARVIFRFAYFAYAAVVFYDSPKVVGTLKALGAMLLFMLIMMIVIATLAVLLHVGNLNT